MEEATRPVIRWRVSGAQALAPISPFLCTMLAAIYLVGSKWTFADLLLAEGTF